MSDHFICQKLCTFFLSHPQFLFQNSKPKKDQSINQTMSDQRGQLSTTQLPAPVEDLIQAIHREKSTPPADEVARRRLAEIGEAESVRILTDIRNWSAVTNLSASIMSRAKKLIMKNSQSSSLTKTPPPPLSPTTTGSRSSLSPQHRVFTSPVSVTSSPKHEGNSSSPNKRRKTLNFSDEIVESFREHFTSMPTASTSEPNDNHMPISDCPLDALAELEFRKAFLILNYLGREKLEDVLTAEQIRRFKNFDKMDRFEAEIWNAFGRENCKGNERRKYLDWDLERHYNYQCHVYADGSCSFKGPFLNKTTTVLQKVVKDENVLIVKFAEEETDGLDIDSGSGMCSLAFNKVFEEGIFVGRKRYQFFVFKDGGKEEKKKSPTSSPVKCYFVCMEAFASFFAKGPQFFKEKSIQEARSIFMHIHKAESLSKYMARFSLILSKTITLEGLDDVIVKVVPDKPCLDEHENPVLDEDKKLRILTDGTGFISVDLALKCPQNCFKGSVPGGSCLQKSEDAVALSEQFAALNQLKTHPCEPPLLIQFRMFHEGKAIKGTVLVNKTLPEKTIVVRKSMLKIDTDPELEGAPSVNRFEIVGTSNKPKQPRLSKNLIALLHYGGVPREFFLNLLTNALRKTQSFVTKRRAALKVASSRDADDDLTISRMILSGIPLDEPFLKHRLSVIAKDEKKNLKAGKIPVSDSFYVMGTADPTGTLNSGEVCVILEHGHISGKVLVYRNPGIHPGDIHVVKAIYVESMKEFVGNSKYGIFFPSKGSRSMADEIAGGDYDGDMYWVSQNPQLLEYFRPSKVWVCGSSSPSVASKDLSKLSAEDLERELFRLYLTARFRPSKAMSLAADYWLVFMDRLLTLGDDCSEEKERLKQKIMKLIDKYYDALDAPKKGKKVEIPQDLRPEKYPHHMDRGEFNTYKSSSILGQIYDEVDKFNELDPIEVWKIPCFEEKIPKEHLEAWQEYYKEYRGDMTAALKGGDESKSDSAAAVYRKYKKILYGIGEDDNADDLDKSRRAWEDIRIEALAVYDAAYQHAEEENDPQKLNFAWKVAGSALLKIFMDEQGEKPICCVPSVIREMFS